MSASVAKGRKSYGCASRAAAPAVATPEEIFHDPSDIQLYRSMIGPEGWCVRYDKTTRKCSIYSDRPYFCRVEPDVFQTLYGISRRYSTKRLAGLLHILKKIWFVDCICSLSFCSSCRDTIKAIYGSDSKELDKFNHSVRS